jgi:hypothetical protein
MPEGKSGIFGDMTRLLQKNAPGGARLEQSA